jgi:hypothetical protein
MMQVLDREPVMKIKIFFSFIQHCRGGKGESGKINLDKLE